MGDGFFFQYFRVESEREKMGRSPCCSKEGLNKGAWTAIEDKILTSYIKVHGEGKWRNLPNRAGLKRCGKSCRLRWLNYLRPDIKRGNISNDEEELIIRLHKLLGNRWSLIAGRLPGRTDNEIKNYWNTTLGKKAKAMPTSPLSPSKSNAKNLKNQTIESNTAEPSDSTTDKIQVIRTRATKCTKALVPDQFYTTNSATITDPYLLEPRGLHQNYLIDHPHQQDEEIQEDLDGICDSDFLNLGSCTEFEGSNFDEKMESEAVGYNSNISISPDHQHQLQYLNDERTMDYWTTGCLEDNATMNFESLAFLLNPEEWP